MNRKEIVEKLNALKLSHSINDEDGWYSCPVSGECLNDNAGDTCNCGADSHNAKVDLLLAYFTTEE